MKNSSIDISYAYFMEYMVCLNIDRFYHHIVKIKAVYTNKERTDIFIKEDYTRVFSTRDSYISWMNSYAIHKYKFNNNYIINSIGIK